MSEYYLAIDLGASSGRHILCHMEEGKMVLEEVHRFDNGMEEKNGHLCWDMDRLFSEILKGMKKCGEMGKAPKYVGIDTWGVDFVLLDENFAQIGDSVGYRDDRTSGMDELLYRTIPEKEVYARTGIQKNIINTIYHLLAIRETHPENFEKAAYFLMVPDYFHFLLTGKPFVEYTNSTTSQLNDPVTHDWNYELLKEIGIPEKMFPKLVLPGTNLGKVKADVEEYLGYAPEVIVPATHDTASAVLAVPTNGETVYISSGTWSLMGIERAEADCSEESRIRNFTNEGGYQYRFRYLKNIMGLWMIQNVRKELSEEGTKYTYAELCEMASKETIPSIVDCNDNAFLNPKSMIRAIRDFCEKSCQKIPKTPAELAAVVYNSLAECYRKTIAEIEEITGNHYDHINIVGGGANADYLNEITAKRTGRTVYAGPTEATAIGNLLIQLMHDGVFADLTEARNCVFTSFDVNTYHS